MNKTKKSKKDGSNLAVVTKLPVTGLFGTPVAYRQFQTLKISTVHLTIKDEASRGREKIRSYA